MKSFIYIFDTAYPTIAKNILERILQSLKPQYIQ